MHFIDKMPVTLSLGNQEEGLVTKIEVDCTAWYTQWPSGAVSVSFEPPNRDESFLLFSQRVGNVVSVDVTKAMTHYHGSGRLIFRLVVGDDLEKRTKVIETLVEPSLASPTGAMPDPVASWITDATQKLAEVDHFVDDAIAATEEATEAAGLTTDAIARANEISATMEGIAPKWADVDISVSALSEGASPTASIAQDETGTSISLGIPKGDTGAQGPVGNVMYATFDIDFDTGELVMTIPDGYTGPTFSINDETGELEVSI